MDGSDAARWEIYPFIPNSFWKSFNLKEILEMNLKIPEIES